MSRIVHRTVAAVALVFVSAAVAGAQQPPAVVVDLIKNVDGVEEKLVALANAIPADKYDWRPGTGVRSTREVLLHVASDNYLLPAGMGVAPDPASGIKADDLSTLATYEKRALDRDAVVAELQKSFAHLRKAMQSTSPAFMGQSVKMFGMEMTGQQLWVLTTTHLHEHLGQMIAYARVSGVKPPWSR